MSTDKSNVLIEGMCKGGTKVLKNVFESEARSAEAFNALLPGGSDGLPYDQFHARTESGGLYPLPRKMAFQATPISDDFTLWYRCTMAQVEENVKKMKYHPWSQTVEEIKEAAEKASGQKWNLAHIIYYENEKDSMGCHSDTFLDLADGSTVGVVSLGSEREMVLHRKDEVKRGDDNPADHVKVKLPNNSLLVLDEETNARWVHGIQKVNASKGPRIAIVFRNSVTFRLSNGVTFGDRCVYKTVEEALENANPSNDASCAKRVERMCELKNHEVWNGPAMHQFITNPIPVVGN
eukprot:TRINITY_DN30654_c0_g1_i1.p2 TRINITY_DN30654_c0_g1~~TRINITY_DN30654_c0_g1_i1.p2  ORF type:complete len:293 (+),score=66.31 TRINITY_DN30654_c0_g1_i1:49-927(+)